MKVYVLTADYGYEGESTIGVYSTVELAVKAAGASDRLFQNQFCIYEAELDGNADCQENLKDVSSALGI